MDQLELILGDLEEQIAETAPTAPEPLPCHRRSRHPGQTRPPAAARQPAALAKASPGHRCPAFPFCAVWPLPACWRMC
jgi:hypothetical protein